MSMNTRTVRRSFLDYFKQQGHRILPSSSVVPHEDPTLLFTNAGMNQFKDVFLGKAQRDYSRAATSQKCIRVGGKHNDLDNVGHTARHLTFFEMIGNFSFGDYFKKEAIQFAWEVSTQVFGFDPERIWPSVFRDDDEAWELWTQYVPAARITRFGEKDNFWMMGETGPCGPCSELYYDRGGRYGTKNTLAEDPDSGRFLEFWNLVFMQYNSLPNGTREPLPRPSIDTGAGLERVMSLKMGVDSVYETDILRGMIGDIEVLAKRPYHVNSPEASAFRVIADHLRCLAFAIADGAQPGNVDRGYVLRKVLRRAVRYGKTIGFERPFLADLMPGLCDKMGEDYPELIESQGRVQEILTLEEEAFIRTLRRGGNLLHQIVSQAQADKRLISGEEAFKLKDTYGLPFDELLLLAKDSSLAVDVERYHALEEESKKRSREANQTKGETAQESVFAHFASAHAPVEFSGYHSLETVATLLGIEHNGNWVSSLQVGDEGALIFDRTPFYAEMGGQVADVGEWRGEKGVFLVTHTSSPYKGVIVHRGKVSKGTVQVGDVFKGMVDAVRRRKIENNHTATHLLHWALHQVLGEHVKQAGSVVEPNRLRFDFSHHKPLSLQELRQVEDLVNAQIRTNAPVSTYELPYEEVQQQREIKQFFGDKYGATVRVVDVAPSKELCGGTHVDALGRIGLFRIVEEGSIASGIRRIQAKTGADAEVLAREQEDLLLRIAHLLKSPPHQVQERVEKVIDEHRVLTLFKKEHRQKEVQALADALFAKVEEKGGISWLVTLLSGLSAEEMKHCSDHLVQRLKNGVLCLAQNDGDKVNFLVRSTPSAVARGIAADRILKICLLHVEGNGGGKAEMAQGSGKKLDQIEKALEAAREEIGRLLESS